MKILFTFIYCTICLVGFSQPIYPKVKQAEPIWSHLLSNPNYVVVDTPDWKGHYGNAYNSIGFMHNSLKIKDDFAYFIAGTHDDNIANDGYGIYKVNYKTGEIAWGEIYNKASGAPGYFACADEVLFRSDGDVELIGNRTIDPKGWNYYPMAYRRVYDDITGEIKQMHYDTSNQSNVPYRSGAWMGENFILQEDSLYLQIYFHLNIPKLSIDAIQINGNQDSVYNFKSIEISYDSITIDAFSFVAFNSEILNDSLWVLLAKIRASDQEVEHDRMELYFVNYKNPDHIFLERRVDVSDKVIYNPLSRNNFDMIKDGEDLLIIGIYHDYDLDPHQQNYLVRVNAKGEVTEHHPRLTVPDSYYAQYLPINRVGNKYYLWGWRSEHSDKIESFDLLSMDKQGKIQYEASFFTTDDNVEDYLSSQIAKIIGDTLILIGRYNVGEAILLKKTSFIMAFDLKDLREGSIVKLDDLLSQFQFRAYPNPTLGNFTTDLPEVNNNVTIHFFDNTGSMAYSSCALVTGANNLDISHLPSGTYYYKVIDGVKVLGFGHIVKVD
ncbi:MAG: T9SS type A sorting domain-containing protein [Saprospiraceae bacterium]